MQTGRIVSPDISHHDEKGGGSPAPFVHTSAAFRLPAYLMKPSNLGRKSEIGAT